MKRILHSLFVALFEPLQILGRYTLYPLNYYTTLDNRSTPGIIALVVWSISLSRYISQEKGKVISLYFSGEIDNQPFYKLLAVPLVGELTMMLQIGLLVVIAAVFGRFWTGSRHNSDITQKSFSFFLCFLV